MSVFTFEASGIQLQKHQVQNYCRCLISLQIEIECKAELAKKDTELKHARQEIEVTD